MPFNTFALRTLIIFSSMAAGAALAQVAPAPQNQLSLAASASIEVPRDWLSVAFSTTREGSDAAVVQQQLKQALDAALAEARKVAKPTQVEVHTGNFALYPRYSPKGSINGWQGSTELVVEGRDLQAISQLAGRIQTLTIARTGYQLSREAREKAEADVSAQAIQAFRSKAEGYAKQFGFAGYSVREVQLNSGDAPTLAPPVMMARASVGVAMAEAALPTEAGKATVAITVSGSVQMK